MRSGVKGLKVRHQLFLPDDLGKRLTRIADGTGRPKSQILGEALETYLNRRNPESNEEALEAKLTGLERHLERIRRIHTLQWEVLARLMRHQMLTSAGLPRPDPSMETAALKQFEAIIDEIAARLAGREPPVASDPTIDKIRQLN